VNIDNAFFSNSRLNFGVRINISLKMIYYIMITQFRLLSYNGHRFNSTNIINCDCKI